VSVALGGITHYPSYTAIDDPTQPIGNNVADLSDSEMWYHIATDYYKFFTLTFSENTTCVLGVIVDTYGDPSQDISHIKILQTVGGTSVLEFEVTSPFNGQPDYLLFRLAAAKNDQFEIYFKRRVTGYGLADDQVTTAGLIFERVEPPGTVIFLR
jgi:hypothetical protein